MNCEKAESIRNIQKSVAIINSVNRSISQYAYDILDRTLSELDFTQMGYIEISAWFRSSFPVRGRLPQYQANLARAKSHLATLNKEHVLIGLDR